MENKTISKNKFAVCILRIIEENKKQAKANKLGNIEDIRLVTSLRKLAASSGVDYASVHKIATGKKNAAWSTVVQIVDGLNLTMESWGKLYDSISDFEVKNLSTNIKSAQKRIDSKRKKY